jgi:hypothetical protein
VSKRQSIPLFCADWIPSVRVVVFQSVISLLGSHQENIAWTILQDAVSNPALVLDDALFALLAVHPANPLVVKSDVHTARIVDPEVLTEMAKNQIPDQCHDKYTEHVLFPLAQMWSVVPPFLDINEKQANMVDERLRRLQQSAYRIIFSQFLNGENAEVFAQRGLDAAKSIAFSDTDGIDLFLYIVYGIGQCVALDGRCWGPLCQLIDFLANAVGSPAKEPTKTSLKAIRRLNAMNLGSNMTFQNPHFVAEKLTVDRMSLLEPLIKYECDHFSVTFWERRFYLFSCQRRRFLLKNPLGVLTSELDDARSLLLELTRLGGELQYELENLKTKTVRLIADVSDPVADMLVDNLLSGNHGLSDVLWINELRLHVLGRRLKKSIKYAQTLATFHTQVSNYQRTFYAQNYKALCKLIESVLTSDPQSEAVQRELTVILLDPIFNRAGSSTLDECVLHLLLKCLPYVVMCHRPQWVLESIHKMLFSLPPWEVNQGTIHPVIRLVELVNTVSIRGNSKPYTVVKPSDFSPLAALLVDAMYSGNFRNFDLPGVVSGMALKQEQVLTYPYFIINEDDGNGGDMESRRSKATVAQLLQRYQKWSKKYSSLYISRTHQPQTLPSVRIILNAILGRFPQLALIHPSLFLSYAALTFGESGLDTKTKIDSVLSTLQSILEPKRQGESGALWGWAPPLSLALSFVHILFTDTANDVAEAVLDGHANTEYLTCKLAAIQLLEWWANTFYGTSKRDQGFWQLVIAMERGEGRVGLLEQYDELRMLACRDESRIVREKAFTLQAGHVLKL